MDENTKNLSNNKFTSYDFLRLLLALLYQNGIYTIDENELEQKLFYYWKSDNFSELFKTLPIEDTLNHKSVILYDEFYREKYFTKYVKSDKLFPNFLTLMYENIDLSPYEEKLSENGKIRIRQIVAELAKRYKVEQTSQTKLNIYGTNPNMHYILPYGNYIGYQAGFKLITDGNVTKTTIQNIKGSYDYYFESPYDFEEAIKLENPEITSLTLQNATYAIKQGLFSEELQYSLVFTELLDETKLQKIIEIANNQYNINKSSHIKKIILK